jgi:fibronectin-binding autotransporter adhesin
MRPPRLRSIVYCICAVQFVGSATPAPAQTNVWSGGSGTSGNWSDASNWFFGTPLSSPTNQLLFTGANRLTTTQNIVDPFNLNTLTYDSSAGAYATFGQALRFVANGATNPSLVSDSPATVTFNNQVIFNATGSIAGTGTGSLVFGPLTVAQGNLSIARTGVTAGALNIGDGIATASATLDTLTNTLTLNGNINYNPAATTPAGTVNGQISLSAGNHTITGMNQGSSTAYSLIVNANMSGTGGITIQDTAGANSPNIILRGTNTYTGPTVINNPSSQVYAGATNTLPSTTDLQLLANSVLSLNPVTPQPGVTTGSFSQTVGSLAGPDNSQIFLGGATLSVGGNNTSTAFTGSIQGTGGSLIKLGTGTLTIGGSTAGYIGSGYGGSTVITGGTLLVNNTVANTSGTGGSSVMVQTTATLGGIGRIVPALGGVVTVDPGGTISPGSPQTSIGTLTLGSAATPTAITIGGTYAANIGTGTSSDLLAITGALNLAGTSTLTITGLASGGLYTLANYTSLTGMFNTVNNLPANYSVVYGPTSLRLVPVPEPALILLLCAAGGSIVGWRRRNRQSRCGVAG